MVTVTPAATEAARKWYVIDAGDRVLGRIATEAARLLQGKHKPAYTPFLDQGDHVVIVNAAAVRLTGRKDLQKLYRSHSGYEGGLREERTSAGAGRPASSKRPCAACCPRHGSATRCIAS